MRLVSKMLRAVLLTVVLADSEAFGEAPAPSAHWGGLAFPDQYSTFTAGLTLNRFTPTDGTGLKYDSTISQTLGLNLITLSRTQHWGDRSAGWSTNLTVGISPTSNDPSEFFQNKVVHQLRHLPPVPSSQPRRDTDVMVDGSVTKWLPLWQPKAIFFWRRHLTRHTLSRVIFEDRHTSPTSHAGFISWRLGSRECAGLSSGACESSRKRSRTACHQTNLASCSTHVRDWPVCPKRQRRNRTYLGTRSRGDLGFGDFCQCSGAKPKTVFLVGSSEWRPCAAGNLER